MGPVEVLVIGFPGSQFNGEIIPALEDLVERQVVSIIDAVLLRRADDGELTVIELEEDGATPEAAALSALIHEVQDLISDEDVQDLAADLEPGSAAAMIVLEHTWVGPLRDAIAGSGGVVLNDVNVPGGVVDEVLAAVAELS